MSAHGIDTAMVLAAGLGTRMRPLTNDRPKALVEVAGKALIDHVLDRLADGGVRRAVVNVHHFADDLETHLARRAAPAIEISDERGLLLETGGGLVRARAKLGENPIIVANIDSVWDEAPNKPGAVETLLRAWEPARMDALLLLAETGASLGYGGRGDFWLTDDARLVRRGEADAAPYAYMGLHVLKPSLLDGFAEEPFSLNKAWDVAAREGRLCGAVLDGFWMHVGDPFARDEAERRLANSAIGAQ